MKATLAKSEGYERTLEITLEADAVRQSYDKQLHRYAREVSVPGFRKGKAPRHLAEKALRPDFLRQNVLEDIGIKAYQEALKAEGLKPISQPRLEWVQFEKGAEMIFRASFDVRPEIQAPDYQHITVKHPRVEVEESDIEAVLKAEQEKRTTLASVEEDRPLESGDLATVNFESWETGVPVEGGKAENMLIEVNDSFVMPGFSKHIVGMKKEEVRKFTDTFPADHPNKVLAGKTIEFEFKLLEIKKRQVPELTDEFTKEISRFSTVDEMRAAVRMQLEVELHTAIANQAIDQILPTLHVHLPTSMLMQTGRNILDEWQKQLQSMGTDLKSFMRNQQWSTERLNNELLPRAQRVALAELVVEAIAKNDKITVSDEEIEHEIERFAKMSNQDTKVVRDALEEDGSINELRDNVLRRKVLEHIFRSIKVEKLEPQAAEASTPAEAEDEKAGEEPAKEQSPEGAASA